MRPGIEHKREHTHTHAQIYIYIYIYWLFYIYIYLYIGWLVYFEAVRLNSSTLAIMPWIYPLDIYIYIYIYIYICRERVRGVD